MPTLSNPMQGRGPRPEDPANDLAHDYRRILGAYIRTARIKAGLTQKEVSEHFGWREAFMSHLEQGRNNIPPEAYEKLAELLQLDKEDFAKTLLRYLNPWLYALTYGKRDAKLRADLGLLPTRFGTTRNQKE